jgi:hypothetical protein
MPINSLCEFQTLPHELRWILGTNRNP